VEHVRDPVVGLGDAQGGVCDPVGVTGGCGQGTLVDAHDLVDGDASVDHVLAVIARVVPTPRDVVGVVARGAGVAGHLDVALVGQDTDVPGLALVTGCDLLVDLDTAALRVVEGQRVGGQVPVQVGVDGEGMAGLFVDGQGVSLPDLCDLGKVDGVHVFVGGVVDAVGLGLALGHGSAVGVGQLPGQGVVGLGDDGGVLGAVRKMADLVDAYGRAGVGLVHRRFDPA